MSKSVNKVMLLGNIGQDPETRTTAGGTLLSTVSLATNDRYKQGEEWKDRTDWHNLVFYGRLAEIVRDYVRKGSKIFVEGRIRHDSWDDKETGRKCYRTSIVASDVTLLDGQSNRAPAPAPGNDPIDDEIPF